MSTFLVKLVKDVLKLKVICRFFYNASLPPDNQGNENGTKRYPNLCKTVQSVSQRKLILLKKFL
jgi:rubredoxin